MAVMRLARAWMSVLGGKRMLFAAEAHLMEIISQE